MRLKLSIHHRYNSVLPLNYQYFLSAFIYRTLARSAPEFAEWLHQKGFEQDGRHYKLFTFGKIEPQHYRIDPERKILQLSCEQSQLTLSFWVSEAMQHFVSGLFQDQTFYIGDAIIGTEFQVAQIQVLPRPDFQPTMRWQLASPACISYQQAGRKHAQYLPPDHPEYSRLLHQHLLRKVASMHPDVPDDLSEAAFQFQPFGKSRSKLMHIKDGIKVRGFEYAFEMTAPPLLQEAAYFAGLGEKNAQGFGLIQSPSSQQ
jgi:CRISPR-associated endoribonuclease Cas6